MSRFISLIISGVIILLSVITIIVRYKLGRKSQK